MIKSLYVAVKELVVEWWTYFAFLNLRNDSEKFIVWRGRSIWSQTVKLLDRLHQRMVFSVTNDKVAELISQEGGLHGYRRKSCRIDQPINDPFTIRSSYAAVNSNWIMNVFNFAELNKLFDKILLFRRAIYLVTDKKVAESITSEGDWFSWSQMIKLQNQLLLSAVFLVTDNEVAEPITPVGSLLSHKQRSCRINYYHFNGIFMIIIAVSE